MDLAISNHGQVTRTPLELTPPPQLPLKLKDVWVFDIFKVHRSPTQRVFSSTGLELVKSQPRSDTLANVIDLFLPSSTQHAASPLVWLVEEEERSEAPDHPQGFLPLNWVRTEQNRSVTCMVLKAKANDRRKISSS
ncbi:hypothetical protein TNCV_7281 [Trichonephila clavipes]|nr:hypothetical protein TNCV_7281 [Trichonephila clavipes]